MLKKIIYFRNTKLGTHLRNSNNWFIKFIKSRFQALYQSEWCEKRVSYGELNNGRIIYIIRRNGTTVGLFSYIFTALARIEEAEKKGWVPVIDMMNYPNGYLDDAMIGKENVWEYYFLQPDNVTLEEAYKSKDVVLSDGSIVEDRPRPSEKLLNNIEGELDRWRRIVNKYLKLNDKTASYIETEYKRLFSHNDRVLGIICRGTDYALLKPKGHPIQPTVAELLDKAYEVISLYKTNVVFIATEDIEIYNELSKQLSSSAKIVHNKKKWVDYKGGFLVTNYDNKERENDKYLSGLEYLTTIYILSRCNCIIGGRPGGATAAMILSKGYEYTYFWDKGNY